MNRRGFTIVELLIVIAIMGILLVLGVVNLRSSQANARDTERKVDIGALATHIELFYSSSSTGRYPSTGLVASGATSVQANLPDIDVKSITAPGVVDPLDTIKVTTNSVETTAGVLPQPSISEYLYQPIQSDGSLCTTGTQQCCKFNLFYHLEVDDSVYVYRSKNQC